MKSGLLMSMPSAMKATVTPVPSKPRDLAVRAPGWSESAWVTPRASGSSWGVVSVADGQVFAGGAMPPVASTSGSAAASTLGACLIRASG